MMRQETVSTLVAVALLLGLTGCGRQSEQQVEILPPALPVTKTEQPRPPGTNRFYVVQNGEDLYVVAMMWGVPPDVLKATNNLSGPELKAGQMLIIPDVQESPASWSTNAEENPIL